MSTRSVANDQEATQCGWRATGRLDPSYLGALVQRELEAKIREIRKNPRYGNGGYYDEHAERFNERGGLWNDRSGRASDGITKTDVADFRSAMAEIGVSLTSDIADALLNQWQRTGEVAPLALTTATESGDAVVMTLFAEAGQEPGHRETFTAEGFEFALVGADMLIARSQASTRLRDAHVITASGTRCSCGGDRCAARKALDSYRRATRPLWQQFVPSPTGEPICVALRLAESFGLHDRSRAKGAPTNHVAAALLLVVRALVEGRLEDSEDFSRLCVLKVFRRAPHRNTLGRMARRPEVLRVLLQMRAALDSELLLEGYPVADLGDDKVRSEPVAAVVLLLRLLTSTGSGRPASGVTRPTLRVVA